MAPTLKLDEELQATICRHIAEGHAVREACRLCGIGKSTLYRWLETARADEEAGRQTVFTEFAEAVATAEAELEGSALEKIRAAAENPKNWTASAWLLERRFPERWSLRNRLQVTGADGEPVQIKIVYEAPEAKDHDEDGSVTVDEAA